MVRGSRTHRSAGPATADASRVDAGEDELNWAARVQRLEGEVAGLRRAMRTRGLIEQAKGMLAERFSCDPEEAFGYLSRLSQDANVRVVDIAADVVGSPRLGPAELDEPVTHPAPTAGPVRAVARTAVSAAAFAQPYR